MALMIDVLPASALLDGQPRQVVDVDRLQAIASVAEDAEHRQPPQSPGDVVDQDVLLAEKDRRPEDGVGDARLDQRLLQRGLASEVLQMANPRTDW